MECGRSAGALTAKMEPIAVANGMSSRYAMMAPVHAPVPGAGMPTKRASASVRDCPVGRPASFFSARTRSGFASFLTNSERSARSVGAIGIMLPRTQMISVAHGFSPIQLPTGTPPRCAKAGPNESMVDLCLGDVRMRPAGRDLRALQLVPLR